MSDIYDYELVYHHRDLVSTTKFSALIELQDLKDHLRTFLISAGWSADQLTFLEDPEEREYKLQKTIEELEMKIEHLEDKLNRYKEVENEDETDDA